MRVDRFEHLAAALGDLPDHLREPRVGVPTVETSRVPERDELVVQVLVLLGDLPRRAVVREVPQQLEQHRTKRRRRRAHGAPPGFAGSAWRGTQEIPPLLLVNSMV